MKVLKVLVAQSCPTLCNPRDYSPPGPSVHGISQVRILEWVDIPFSRGFSQPKDQTQVSCRQIIYHLSHQGSSNDNELYQKCYESTSDTGGLEKSFTEEVKFEC